MENSNTNIAPFLRDNLNRLLLEIRKEYPHRSTMYKRICAAYTMHASTPVDQVISQIPTTVYAKMESLKVRLYKTENFTFNPPPVSTSNWPVRGWINYIDAYGLWII